MKIKSLVQSKNTNNRPEKLMVNISTFQNQSKTKVTQTTAQKNDKKLKLNDKKLLMNIHFSLDIP